MFTNQFKLLVASLVVLVAIFGFVVNQVSVTKRINLVELQGQRALFFSQQALETVKKSVTLTPVPTASPSAKPTALPTKAVKNVK